MQAKKKIKKKITVDGIKYKIDHQVFKVIEQLETQLTNHTLALYNYIEIFHDKTDNQDKKNVLYEYCMQLPHAEVIEEQIQNPEEKTIAEGEPEEVIA
tara:strand:- start:105 stop:398 length:294 start_codon:yes stop_codon:yes gene_type:complete